MSSWFNRKPSETETVPPRVSPADMQPEVIEEKVIAALKQVYDPEIPLNIYDLGLIYGLEIDGQGRVDIRMTLTAPGCPVAHSFPGTVEEVVRAVDGVNQARVHLVWDPPWSQQCMSDEARLQLGLL